MKSRGQHIERLAGHARLYIRVILMLVAASGSCIVEAADKVGERVAKPQEKQDGTNTTKVEAKVDAKPNATAEANAGLKAFGNMIPLGSRSRGVRIPSFDNGRPSSLIVADAMTRLDDDRLFSEKMTIHVYAEKKEEDMRIDMKTGIYNMGAQILSSTDRSRVSRTDFQIEGDSMVYDTTTAQGKMLGNVEMIIFDASAASKKMNIQTGGKPAAVGQKTPEKQQADKPVERK